MNQDDVKDIYGSPPKPLLNPREQYSVDMAQKAGRAADARDTFAAEVEKARKTYTLEDEVPARDRHWNEWCELFQDDETGHALRKHLLYSLKQFETLSHQLKFRRQEDRARFERLAAALVFDAAVHYLSRERGEIIIELDKNILDKKDMYANRALSYSARTFPVVLEALHLTDWLHVTKPQRPNIPADDWADKKAWIAYDPQSGEFYKRATTFKAGSKLREVCGQLRVGPDVFASNYDAAEVMMVKGTTKDSAPVQYRDEDFPGIADEREKVRLINTALKASEITFHPEEGLRLPAHRLPTKRVDVREKALRQVFLRNSMEHGGRLWGIAHEPCWYPLSHDYRTATLRLNGQRLVGLDFKELGVRLAYAYISKPLSPDATPYNIPGLRRESRPGIKRMVSAMLNTTKLDQWTNWPKDLWYDMASGRNEFIHPEDHLPVQEFIERILIEHVDLYDVFNSEIGLKLMRWESKILVGSLLELIQRHQVVALPVHDCLYVGAQNVAITKKVLEAWSKEVTGGAIIKVEVKG